jgi:hypothetical protein
MAVNNVFLAWLVILQREHQDRHAYVVDSVSTGRVVFEGQSWSGGMTRYIVGR